MCSCLGVHFYHISLRVCVRVRAHVRILALLPRHPDRLQPPLTALNSEPSTVYGVVA